MSVPMWNFLFALLLLTTAALWVVHGIHLWQLHKLTRRVKMLEAEVNK